MAETNLEESNLAHVGSDEDKAARKTAAGLEAAWEGAGSKPGVRVWRVENGRTDPGGGPDFGIAPWPREQYGSFHGGDAYIVLGTTTEEEGGEEIQFKLKHDVYLWIGSKSTQDKYAVAAYKAAELGDFLGGARGATVRHHREVDGRESAGFLARFPDRTIARLDGGGECSCGLRRAERVEITPRLFRVYKQGALVQALEVPCGAEALNPDDAFVLDAGCEVVYARFGATCSPFERSEAAEVAREIAVARGGKCRVVAVDDAGEENSWFWEGIHNASVEMPEPECIPEEEEEEYVSVVGDAKEPRLADANAIVRSSNEVNAGKESPEQARATCSTPLAPAATTYRSERTTAIDAGERELGRDEMYLYNTDQWTHKSAANPREGRDGVGVTATKASRDTRAGLGFQKKVRHCTERIFVSRVADDSIFASSGLAAGDEVVSIEVPVFALTAAEIVNVVNESEGYVTIVTARQAGKKSKRGWLGLRREADFVVITSAEKGDRSVDAGVGFRKMGGRILVARIEKGSIFAETGLRLDDEVVAVEVGVNGRTAEEIADLVKESEGDVALFVVPQHPSALMRARESDKRYHFGDITKSVVAKSKMKAGAWRGSDKRT